MLKLDQLTNLLIELLRALFVDAVSSHVQQWVERLLSRRAPKDMPAILRHIHIRCRTRLLNRVSTGQEGSKAS
jgi:hypothetical protein